MTERHFTSEDVFALLDVGQTEEVEEEAEIIMEGSDEEFSGSDEEFSWCDSDLEGESGE